MPNTNNLPTMYNYGIVYVKQKTNNNFPCLFTILNETDTQNNNQIDTYEFNNFVLNNYKLSGNSISQENNNKSPITYTSNLDTNILKDENVMRLQHFFVNMNILNKSPAIKYSKYVWDTTNTQQGVNGIYTFYCLGDIAKKIIKLKLVKQTPKDTNILLKCGNTNTNYYLQGSEQFIDTNDTKNSTLKSSNVLLKLSPNQIVVGYKNQNLLRYEINFNNKPIHFLMLKVVDGEKLVGLSINSSSELSINLLPNLFYNSKIYKTSYNAITYIIEYSFNYMIPYYNNLYTPYFKVGNTNLSIPNGAITGCLLNLPLEISQFADIEKFIDLPATEEYSKMLLKLASRSKSGIPNPYYFNPINGFNYSIVFNNLVQLGDGTTSASCDAIITSVADGQQIQFDTCYFVYSSDKPNIIQLSFKKQSTPDPLVISPAEFGDIAKNLQVEQRFDIRLVCQPSAPGSDIGKEILSLNGANLNTGFMKIINKNVVPALSSITYTLSVGYTNNTRSQDILSYEVKLSATLSRQNNSQEYTYGKMTDTISETLNEKISRIVSPMFGLDNKLNMMEQQLEKTQDAYYFNNLSNGQSSFRFYNNT